MPKESKLELKVGLFVLASLVGLIVFIFKVSDTTGLERGKTIRAVFGFANGLKKSAPVRIAGVDEGIVKDIQLFFDPSDGKTKVAVDLWIKGGTMIPADSTIVVNQLGLMGEKYVEIFPGTDRQNFLRGGQEVIAKDPVAQSVLSDRMMEVSDKLETAVAGVNRIISDEKNVESILVFRHLSHRVPQERVNARSFKECFKHTHDIFAIVGLRKHAQIFFHFERHAV